MFHKIIGSTPEDTKIAVARTNLSLEKLGEFDLFVRLYYKYIDREYTNNPLRYLNKLRENPEGNSQLIEELKMMFVLLKSNKHTSIKTDWTILLNSDRSSPPSDIKKAKNEFKAWYNKKIIEISTLNLTELNLLKNLALYFLP